MKKYGISRKIDELGRIVLPKEIRKNMRIRENDELLIDVLDDKIILSKAYGIESSKVLNDVVYVMHQEFDIDILISNRDSIIVSSNSKYLHKNINESIIGEILNNSSLTSSCVSNICLFEDIMNIAYLIKPINCHGDIVGSLLCLSNNPLTDNLVSAASIITKFLEKYLEE